MAAEVHWFCSYCNPSHQRRTSDMETNTGYAVTPLDTTPPLGWRAGVNGKHACETCLARRPGVAADLAGRRDEDSNVFRGSWPAHTSPFGAARG